MRFQTKTLLKITHHARRVAWRELSILGHCDHRCRYTHYCDVRIHRWGHLSLCVVRPHISCDGLLDIVWIGHGLRHGSVLCMLICRLHCWCVCMFVTFHRWFDIGLDLWLPSIGFACICHDTIECSIVNWQRQMLILCILFPRWSHWKWRPDVMPSNNNCVQDWDFSWHINIDDGSSQFQVRFVVGNASNEIDSEM